MLCNINQNSNYTCYISITICNHIAFIGAAQSSLANVERYDPKTNTWSAVSQMLTRRSLLNLAALEGKLKWCYINLSFCHWLYLLIAQYPCMHHISVSVVLDVDHCQTRVKALSSKRFFSFFYNELLKHDFHLAPTMRCSFDVER